MASYITYVSIISSLSCMLYYIVGIAWVYPFKGPQDAKKTSRQMSRYQKRWNPGEGWIRGMATQSFNPKE